jgi:hypothetical protein
MRLSLNQRGASQILLPLFLLAAIGLGVYLTQQQTELTPSAQETTAPTGCKKVTPGTRSVKYKNCQSASEPCGDETSSQASSGEQDVDANFQFAGKTVASYPLKEAVWDFGGWKLYDMKGPRQSDGDRTSISTGRFDGPSGKSYKEVDSDPAGANREAYKITYREDGGQSTVVEYAYTTKGSGLVNYQGAPTSEKYDPSKSYAFVPETAGAKCDGTGSTTGSKKTGEACTKGPDCQSGSCTNNKCDATGVKKGGESCTKGSECQSNQCTNNKCSGGSRTVGQSCDGPSECASNKCENNKCVSATASSSPRSSSSPRPSGSSSSTGGGGGTAPGASTAPGTSPAPSASITASASPTGSTPGSVPVSLTKAEITQFKASFDALYTRLGATKDTGNLRVVSGIANNELTSIVSQLSTCPDDANVGKCLDDKFRTRFDFAKTAARLSAFYGIFNNVSGLCVKSDFGLNPLITATSSNSTQGRVNLCTEPTAAQKVWRIFAGGKFEPVLSTDTRWPNNPTCAALPQDVMTHYRNAEKLFSTQAGFLSNTLCDGETTAEAPGGSENPAPSSSPVASPSPSPSASASASKGFVTIAAIFNDSQKITI